MRLLRSLGQVFLKSKKYIFKTVELSDIEGATVLEIGPGSGRMTVHLAERAEKVVCVELDKRFYSYLKERFKDVPNIKVVNSDILSFSPCKISSELVVFGNVPYQISERLIRYLVEHRACLKRAYLMLQKEFVQKIVAKPGSKLYTPLNCYLKYYADTTKLLDVPARAFSPVPKVDSSFIKIEFHSDLPYKFKDEKYLFAVINKAFSQRRKKIVNCFACLKANKDIFSSLGVTPDVRPEDISLQGYISLAKELQKNGVDF